MPKIIGMHTTGIPVGSIVPSPTSNALAGTLICDGRAVLRTTYSKLFAIIGTSYGSGNGSTTFNLPDFRYQFLRGYGDQISVTGSGAPDLVNDTATFTNHGINRTGMRIRYVSGTLDGISNLINPTRQDHYAIVVDSNTLAFAATYSDAINNVRRPLANTTNTAVITQWEDPDLSSRNQSAFGGNATGVGTRQFDQMQGHRHNRNTAGTVEWTLFNAAGGRNTTGGVYNEGTVTTTGNAVTDTTTNGDPRTGKETRPSNVYVNYCIVYE